MSEHARLRTAAVTLAREVMGDESGAQAQAQAQAQARAQAQPIARADASHKPAGAGAGAADGASAGAVGLERVLEALSGDVPSSGAHGSALGAISQSIRAWWLEGLGRWQWRQGTCPQAASSGHPGLSSDG